MKKTHCWLVGHTKTNGGHSWPARFRVPDYLLIDKYKGFFLKCMFYTWLIYILICVESKIVRGAWLFYETRRGNGRGMSLSKCEGQLISLSVCCDAAEIILMDLVWWPFAAVRPQ